MAVNKKPTDEQIKEFWEWCGFELKGHPTQHGMFWVRPNGEYRPELPPVDPNNLFKYAVPKSDMQDIHFQWRNPSGNYFGWRCWLRPRGIESKPVYYSDAWYDTPALALFWAIYEVIKG